MIPKFRCFVRNKRMFEVEAIDFAEKEVQVPVYDKDTGDYLASTSFNFDDIILMQSTGLFDKNGVEIFEGSVLTDEGDYGLDSWIFGKVYWDKEELSWLVEWPILNEVHSLAITPYRTVQGNIYEHPDLVEVGR